MGRKKIVFLKRTRDPRAKQDFNLADNIFNDLDLPKLKRVKINKELEEKHNLHLEKISTENKLSKDDFNW